MNMNPKNKRSIGRQSATPARAVKAPLSDSGLPLPHERDESPDAAPAVPDPLMTQAKRDIDAGLVDTDMHATPGQNAKLRERMVPGAGGKPPSAKRR
jgi:hypothetical protein